MTRDEAKDVLELLEHIKEYIAVEKIRSTFINPFYEKSTTRDNCSFLHGNFHLGGTKSGRLSSSQPNLQTIPSTGTKHAKIIKRCFEPPKDWILVGADYSSLEDRISALTTKDPNKLKVYTDHYDGHCLRAYYYFHDQMPDIDPNSVKSINSIAKKYPKLRQKSKTPTFALTYGGTYRTLMKNVGLSYDEAVKIENNYHELYSVSDQWVKSKLREASKTGYVELAFGLRLYTPILKQILFESESSMPFEAHKEKKTAGNALGQSYGLLNTKSANLFMERVWNSQWSDSVLPIAQIHDAQYYLIRNNIQCLKWTNDNLIECMEWNELPEIQHPEVKLGAELELYWPNWSNAIAIPNKASYPQIQQCIKQGIQDYADQST